MTQKNPHTQKLLKHCISIRIIFVCIFTTTATTTTTTTTTYRNQSLGLSYVMVGAFGKKYPCWHSDSDPTLIQRTKMDQQSIYCYQSTLCQLICQRWANTKIKRWPNKWSLAVTTTTIVAELNRYMARRRTIFMPVYSKQEYPNCLHLYLGNGQKFI